MRTKGTAGVDWEVRVDFSRLRAERAAKAQEEMEKHEDIGALVLFRESNIRYVTGSWIGNWVVDKMPYRYAFLPRGGKPILYGCWHDCEQQEEQHLMPWIDVRLNRTSRRGGVGAEATKIITGQWATDLKNALKEFGVSGMKVGFDLLDWPMVEALQEANIQCCDAQSLMETARLVKTEDEVEILRQAATMGTAALWACKEAMRPGIRERELDGVAAQAVYSLGCEHTVELHCFSGQNTNPNFSRTQDRMIDYGDMVNIDVIHQHLGYQVPCHRNFVCGGKPTQRQIDVNKKCRDIVYTMIDAIKEGVMTSDVLKVMPSGLVHGIGTSHWGMPYISPRDEDRFVTEQFPIELKENMCLGPETWLGDDEGKEGALIQEVGFVTKTGFEVITKYPSDELMG